MAELSEMRASDEQFDAKVTVLCELVDHHVREEEKEMFKKLQESGADLQDLAQQFEERKNELAAQPLPNMQATLVISNDDSLDAEKKKTKARPVKSRSSSAQKRKSA